MSEQKKQRKKLNIIDIIVIVLLLAVVAFFVVRGIEVSRAAQVLEVEHKERNENARTIPDDFEPNLRVVLICRNLVTEDAERYAQIEYRRLYSNYALLNAYISDITVRPTVVRTVTDKGEEVSTQSDMLSDLVFIVDAQVDLSNPDSVIDGNFNPLIGSQELRVGKQYVLKTMELELTTTVTDMEIFYEGK